MPIAVDQQAVPSHESILIHALSFHLTFPLSKWFIHSLLVLPIVTFISTLVSCQWIYWRYPFNPLPFISQTGNEPPERGLFTFGMTLMAFQWLICGNVLKEKWWTVASFGLLLVGAFQGAHAPYLHFPGAFISFIFANGALIRQSQSLLFSRILLLLACLCIAGIIGTAIASQYARDNFTLDVWQSFARDHFWFRVVWISSSAVEWLNGAAIVISLWTQIYSLSKENRTEQNPLLD